MLDKYLYINELQSKMIDLQKDLFFSHLRKCHNMSNSFFFYKKLYRNYKVRENNKRRIIYFLNNENKKKFKKVFFYYFVNNYFLPFFIKSIEKSIANYLNINVLVSFNIYFKMKINVKKKRKTFKIEPNTLYLPITSAKILCDFLVIKATLEDSRYSIDNGYRIIRKWQLKNLKMKNLLLSLYKHNKGMDYINVVKEYALKKYPILGIRIECSGTAKKGKRKKKWFYADSIKTFKTLSWKAPNSTICADLDYYQSYATTSRSSLGIKIWTFYKTYIRNSNGKIISFLLLE